MKWLKYYMLDADNHVVEAADLMTWGRWFERAENRIVGYTQITSQLRVSTVFLGMDHRFSLDRAGPPLVFETMVFGASGDEEYCRRYSSWDDAKAGHDAMVRRMREARRQKKPPVETGG